MKRRTFFAALGALPFVGKLVRDKPAAPVKLGDWEVDGGADAYFGDAWNDDTAMYQRAITAARELGRAAATTADYEAVQVLGEFYR